MKNHKLFHIILITEIALPLNSEADGFAFVKDTGLRRQALELSPGEGVTVRLDGMIPKDAEAKAEDVTGEYAGRNLGASHNEKQSEDFHLSVTAAERMRHWQQWTSAFTAEKKKFSRRRKNRSGWRSLRMRSALPSKAAGASRSGISRTTGLPSKRNISYIMPKERSGAHFALYRQVSASGGPIKDYYPLKGYEEIITGEDGPTGYTGAEHIRGYYLLLLFGALLALIALPVWSRHRKQK